MTSTGSASDVASKGRKLTGVLLRCRYGEGRKGRWNMVPWEAARPEACDVSGGHGQEERGTGQGEESQATEDALCQHSNMLGGRRPGAAGLGPCTPRPPGGRALTSTLVEGHS